MRGVLLAGFWLAVSLCLQGCGAGSGLAKVSGKVTVAGQPMSDIVVSFLPESGARPVTGVTDSNGRFTLSTLSAADGAAPGKYKVTFTKTAPAPTEGDYSIPTGPPANLPFNAKYTSADTSGITAEVVAGKVNDLPAWDLEK